LSPTTPFHGGEWGTKERALQNKEKTNFTFLKAILERFKNIVYFEVGLLFIGNLD
jgi:hypothetical protein